MSGGGGPLSDGILDVPDEYEGNLAGRRNAPVSMQC